MPCIILSVTHTCICLFLKDRDCHFPHCVDPHNEAQGYQVLSYFQFCYCDKIPRKQQLQGRKGLSYNFRLKSIIAEIQGRRSKHLVHGQQHKETNRCMLAPQVDFSYTVQDLTQNGTTYNVLGRPILVKPN